MDFVDFAAAIDGLTRMDGRRVSLSIAPSDDPSRVTAGVVGTLRHGDLDRAESGFEQEGWAVALPDDPQRVWFRIETGERGGMSLYLSPSWFTEAEVGGRAGLIIRMGNIELRFMDLSFLERTR